MALIILKTASGWESERENDEKANQFIEAHNSFLTHYKGILPAQIDIERMSVLLDLESSDELPDIATVKKMVAQLEQWEKMDNSLHHAELIIEQSEKSFSSDSKQTKKIQQQETPGWSKRWRLHIDPKHQIHGPYAYDKGGSAIEDGVDENFSYSANIMGAEKFFQNYDGVYDLNFYCQLHAQCMRTKSGVLENSRVRNNADYIHVRVGAFGSIDAQALEDKLATKVMDASAQENVDVDRKNFKKALENGEYFAGGVHSYLQDRSSDVEARVKEWFIDFNKNMKNVKTKESKLYVIAALYKKLECAHPFKDGNGRVNRLLLNGLLKKHGLSETVLSDCGCAHYMSVDSIVKEIIRGMNEFNFMQRLSDGMSWQKQNKEIGEWEKKHEVKMEYSLLYGEKLHQAWELCYKLKEVELKLSRAFKREEFDKLPASIKESYAKAYGRKKEQLLKNIEVVSEKLRALIDEAKDFKESYSTKKLRGKALKYITSGLPANQRAPLQPLPVVNSRNSFL